ncbi:MAG: hypothetical protein ACM3X6_05365 [Patescibacteria group bacterium]
MKRGEVYYAAVPYLPEYPLNFFIEDCDSDGKKLGTGRLQTQLPEQQLRGRDKNPEYHVVLPFKRRMVLLFSSDKLLADPRIPSALVMPIHTITENQAVNNPFHRKLIEANCFREAFYLGERSGRKAMVSVIEVKTIAKSLIYEHANISLSAQELTSIDVRFADCVGSSVILACQVCDRNCQACEILKAANQLRRI